MRYITLLIAIAPLFAAGQSPHLDAAIAHAQNSLAPNTTLMVSASGMITMDHLDDGEVVQRDIVYAEDLDTASFGLDPARHRLNMRCKADRPRCIASVAYKLDLEKRGSQGSLLLTQEREEQALAKHAMTALIKLMINEPSQNETSLMLLRKSPTDRTPQP